MLPFHYNPNRILPVLLAIASLLLAASVSAEPASIARQKVGIPPVAWSRPIGLPFDTAGHPYEESTKIDDGAWAGLPLGGLGTGSIGRTYRGDFARWHLDVGTHRFESLPANQFSVFVAQNGQSQAHVLSTIRPERPEVLPEWNWDMPVGAGTYFALFPKAWFVYDWDALPVRLTQKQFSPVIPNNYRESSYPVGIFEWTVENPTAEPLTLGLMFSWQNMAGWGWNKDLEGGNTNTALAQDGLTGLVFSRPFETAAEEWDGDFAIVTPQQPGVTVSYRSRFPLTGGGDTWADFSADGALDNLADPTPAQPQEQLAGALAVTIELQPGQSKTIPFALAWDLPITQFGAGAKWLKRYTQFYGATGHNAWAIAADALGHYPAWEDDINIWQQPILEAPNRPDWYKAALFNELYYLVDGGTVWENGQPGGPPPAAGLGRFAYLESADYPYYNTFDVHYYASFALAQLWPELEKSLLRDFAAAIPTGDPADVRPIIATGQTVPRKVAGAVPHDLGSPQEDPWLRLNAFNWQDSNTWKDLNSKFVLQLWRDYIFTGDPALISDLWPAAVQALDYLHQFDRDGDGLPEHDGVPDQTYDNWVMTGPSAYGGSLWLASLEAAVKMAEWLGDAEHAAQYQGWLDSGKAAFEAKLWNEAGQYYNFDAGGGPHSDSIMADQLAGQWYADAIGLPDIAPAEHIDAALQTIFAKNVQGFAGGGMGAVNGMRPDGTVDTTSHQSQEVWTGVSYALAAEMLHRGLIGQGWATAWGVADVTYNRGGFWFRTPEAWRSDLSYRAGMDMRPLSIWAIESALQRNQAEPIPAGAEPLRLTADDGVVLSALYFAPPEEKAPAVLLLHQRGGRKENWNSFAQLAQKNGYAVMTVDFRGHGQSKGTVNWYGTDLDVAAAFAELTSRPEVDTSRVAIIGASIGTQEGITFAAAHPDQVSGVALLSAFASWEIEQAIQRYPGRVLIMATNGDKAATQVTGQLKELAPKARTVILKNSDRHGTQMLGSELKIEPILLGWLAQAATPKK
jgi:non-lysosomal glucosylceramidase